MWAPAHPISEADVRQLIVGKRRFFKEAFRLQTDHDWYTRFGHSALYPGDAEGE